MKSKHLWMLALGVAAFWFYRKRKQAQAQAALAAPDQTIPPTVAQMPFMARGAIPGQYTGGAP